jgi:hypothetical protein
LYCECGADGCLALGFPRASVALRLLDQVAVTENQTNKQQQQQQPQQQQQLSSFTPVAGTPELAEQHLTPTWMSLLPTGMYRSCALAAFA